MPKTKISRSTRKLITVKANVGLKVTGATAVTKVVNSARPDNKKYLGTTHYRNVSKKNSYSDLSDTQAGYSDYNRDGYYSVRADYADLRPSPKNIRGALTKVLTPVNSITVQKGAMRYWGAKKGNDYVSSAVKKFTTAKMPRGTNLGKLESQVKSQLAKISAKRQETVNFFNANKKRIHALSSDSGNLNLGKGWDYNKPTKRDKAGDFNAVQSMSLSELKRKMASILKKKNAYNMKVAKYGV